MGIFCLCGVALVESLFAGAVRVPHRIIRFTSILRCFFSPLPHVRLRPHTRDARRRGSRAVGLDLSGVCFKHTRILPGVGVSHTTKMRVIRSL
jgi:hypothetical protein